MKRYSCAVCGYIYDESLGDETVNIKPMTLFSQVPDTFVCPLCGMGKHAYKEVD